MDFSHINWLATVVAALSSFLVGGLWYSKILFGSAWMTASNLTLDQVKTGNKGKIFGFTFLFSLIMAINIAIYLSDPTGTNIEFGSKVGFHAGLIAFSAIGIAGLFELKSWKYIFINGGYSLVSLTLMGLIIGAWK